MPRTFKVKFHGDLSDGDAVKISKALHRATAKWFKQGHDIRITLEDASE